MAEYLYGVHAVRAALEAGRVLELRPGADNRRVRDLVRMAREGGVHVERDSREGLTLLLGHSRHQGVAALAEEGEDAPVDLEQLVDRARSGEPLLLLVLDGVKDPHNLGACLRTADAAGVDAVLAPKDRASPITPAVRKVAAGGAESVPFVSVTNLARALKALKEAGVWVAGLDDAADQAFHELDLKGPLALVLGGEAEGLRRLTTEHCDFIGALPMHGSVDSLNVSVATGICLYEALRQRA